MDEYKRRDMDEYNNKSIHIRTDPTLFEERRRERVCAAVTYGPHSTLMEPILSKPFSHRLRHSALRSILRPWKFSNS